MRLVLAVTAVLIAVVLSSAGTANAAVSCSYDGTHAVSVNMTANADPATIMVNLGAIQVNGSSCGAATVNNTNEIVVTGSAGAQNTAISLAGGDFVHSSGSGELQIKFSLKLSTGTDSLAVLGGTGDDTVRLGTNGINLNADSDIDVTLGSVEKIQLQDFLGGTNTFTANGGFGTGAVVPGIVGITGGPEDDTIVGGDGNDSLFANDGNDTIDGGAGSEFIIAGDGNDVISGGEDVDSITPGSGNDTVDGGPGNDSVFAGGFPDGNDTYSGGTGSDNLSYAVRGSAGIALSLDGVANDGRPGMETDNAMPDFEAVAGSQGPDVLVGSPGDETLDGGGGGDTVSGGAGDDSVFGGFLDAGIDTVNGGDGNDNISGGSGADQLNGDAGADSLSGDQGNDTEKGGRGPDQFNQAGTTLPDGSDFLQGGDGIDRVNYFGRTGNLTITLDNNANDGLPGEKDNVKADVENVFSGFGNDSITGSAGVNSINGADGDDTIKGLDGADVLSGDNDDDTITGGDGSDNMAGGFGADSFHALDGGTDIVTGGSDADTDTVLDSDPFDSLSQIP
jgi:Ca2+-binding RTX toxin-like protein